MTEKEKPKPVPQEKPQPEKKPVHYVLNAETGYILRKP
jgi:hypothetical protein